jgi:hypothetical protein
MTDSLRKQVRDHYAQQRLSDEQFKKLSAMINASSTANAGAQVSQETCTSKQVRSRKFYYMGGGLVSTLLVAIVLVLSPLSQHRVGVQAIAIEVASNHSHLKPLTIQSSSYERNKAFFSQLSFQVTKSSLIDNQRFQLLGGRYCSLNGLKAAQLRVRDTTDNSIQTLYQVENSSDYFSNIPKVANNDLPVTIDIDGVPVTVWSENGIIYSLTDAAVNSE